MADLDPEVAVQLEKRGKVAIITLNAEKKLNAMNLACYFRIAKLLYEIADMPDIVVTVVTGKGRYFSAYVKEQVETAQTNKQTHTPTLTHYTHTTAAQTSPSPGPAPTPCPTHASTGCAASSPTTYTSRTPSTRTRRS